MEALGVDVSVSGAFNGKEVHLKTDARSVSSKNAEDERDGGEKVETEKLVKNLFRAVEVILHLLHICHVYQDLW